MITSRSGHRWAPLACACLALPLAAAGWARSADACSPPPPPRPGVHGRTLHLPAARGAFPINAGFIVSYQAGGSARPDPAKVRLRLKGGAFVALTGRWLGGSGAGGRFGRLASPGYLLRPVKPLLPGRTYEILDNVPKVPCARDCLSGKLHVFATFTTARTADRTAPIHTGPVGVRHSWNTCTSSACCGPFRNRLAMLKLGVARDLPGGTVIYNVYRMPDLAKPLAQIARTSGFAVPGFFTFYGICGKLGQGIAVYGPAMVASPGRYVVRVMDLAGNEERNTRAVTVDTSCTPRRDAGAAGRYDGGGGHDRGVSPRTDSGGRRDTGRRDTGRTIKPDTAAPPRPDAAGGKGGSSGGSGGKGGCALAGGGADLGLAALLLLALVRRRR